MKIVLALYMLVYVFENAFQKRKCMGSHEQSNWQQNLTDRTRHPEGTHRPPNQSLRWDQITSDISPTDHSPSSSDILNQRQIFEHLGQWGTSWYAHESSQPLETPAVPSQPESVQENPNSGQYSESSHINQNVFQSSIAIDYTLLSQYQVEQSLVSPEQTLSSPFPCDFSAHPQTSYDSSSIPQNSDLLAVHFNHLDSISSDVLSSSSNIHVEQAQWIIPNDEQTIHHLQQQEDTFRPDRTLTELRVIAQAYIQAGGSKGLPPNVKADIKARPFTSTEVAIIGSLFSGLPNTKKLQDAVYAKSAARMTTLANYEKTSAGKERRKKGQTKYRKTPAGKEALARSRKKRVPEREENRTDTQIFKIPGIEVFKVQDFGTSS